MSKEQMPSNGTEDSSEDMSLAIEAIASKNIQPNGTINIPTVGESVIFGPTGEKTCTHIMFVDETGAKRMIELSEAFDVNVEPRLLYRAARKAVAAIEEDPSSDVISVDTEELRQRN